MHSQTVLELSLNKLTDGGTTMLGIEGTVDVVLFDPSPTYHPHPISLHTKRG